MSNVEEIYNQLEQAETDEDILVALTLLPKVLDPSQLEEAFHHIPWQFIHRLLISGNPDMEQVGTVIWCHFCSSNLMGKSKLLKRIEPISKLLPSTIIMQKFVDILGSDKARTYFSAPVLTRIADTRSDLALDFIEYYLRVEETFKQSIGAIFLPMCARLLLSKSKLMFKALSTAVKLLAMYPDSSFLDQETLKIFNLACRQLMASKLSKENSQATLILSAMMGKRCLEIESDAEWDAGILEKMEILEDEDDLDTFIEQIELKQIIPRIALTKGQFLIILTHICGAEIRFQLDTSSAEISDEERQSLPLLYSLLETIVEITVVDEIKDTKAIDSIRKGLSETFLDVSSFLVERWDLYVVSEDSSILDNLPTLFSFGAYSKWVDEAGGDEEEIERLIPFLVWIQARKFESGEGYLIGIGLLHHVTAEALDAYTNSNGPRLLVAKFLETRKIDNQIALLSVLLNLVVAGYKSTIFDPLMTNLETILALPANKHDQLLLLAQSSVVYVFLRRNGSYTTKFAMKDVMKFVSMRVRLPEDTWELWYLTVSALGDMDLAINSIYLDTIGGLTDLIEGEERKALDKLLSLIK